MQVLNPERDAELYKAYKSAFSKPDVLSHQQAILCAISSPCSQYFVSSQDAYRYIMCRLKGKRWWRARSSASKLKEQAFRQIYKQFLLLRVKREFKGCSTRFVASFACCSQAPCFFISYRRAYEIIRQFKKYGEVRKRKRTFSDIRASMSQP